MDDKDYHELMADLYKQQREPKGARPQNVGEIEWKNRHLISAKLNEALYADLMAFCRSKGYSVNSAIKEILTKHFNHV